MSELISVIIPVYNTEHYLSRCIESVCGNSYHSLEIILVDDGSSDQSGHICDSYAKMDSRVRVFHQQNAGVSKSRNFGISVSTGKYIAFVDSDDYIDIDYFEKLVFQINKYNTQLAICSIVHEKKDEKICNEGQDMVIIFAKNNDEYRSNFLFLNQNFFLYGPVNKLYIAEIIKNWNVMFPNELSYGEDLIFNFAYLARCNRISYSPRPYYYYNHDNDNSLSHRYRDDSWETGLKLNRCIMQFCSKRNLMTDEMRRYIAERIFDDAYNGIFGIIHLNKKIALKESYARIQAIVNSNEVRNAMLLANTSKYKKQFVNWMRRRNVLALTTWVILYKIKLRYKG